MTKLPKQEEEDVYGADYLCTQLMDDFNDSDATIDNVTPVHKPSAKERTVKRRQERTEDNSDEPQMKSRILTRNLDEEIQWDSTDEDEQLPKCMTKGVGKKSKVAVAFRSQDSEIPQKERSSFESVSDVFSRCSVTLH